MNELVLALPVVAGIASERLINTAFFWIHNKQWKNEVFKIATFGADLTAISGGNIIDQAVEQLGSEMDFKNTPREIATARLGFFKLLAGLGLSIKALSDLTRQDGLLDAYTTMSIAVPFLVGGTIDAISAQESFNFPVLTNEGMPKTLSDVLFKGW